MNQSQSSTESATICVRKKKLSIVCAALLSGVALQSLLALETQAVEGASAIELQATALMAEVNTQSNLAASDNILAGGLDTTLGDTDAAQNGTTETVTSTATTRSQKITRLSRLPVKSQQVIDAESREIDQMAARIKEMIKARHTAEAYNIETHLAINSLRDQMVGIQSRLNAANSDRDQLTIERDDLLARLNALEAERDSLSSNRDHLAAQRNDLDERLRLLLAERDNAVDTIETLGQQLGNQQNTMQLLRTEAVDIGDSLANRESEIAKLENHISRLTGEYDGLKIHGDQLKSDLATSRAAGEVLEDQLEHRQEQLKVKQETLDKKLVELDSAEEEIERLQQALGSAAEKRAQLLAQQRKMDQHIDGLQIDLAGLKERFGTTSKQRDAALGKIARLEKTLANTRQTASERQNKLSLLNQSFDTVKQQLGGVVTNRDSLASEKQQLESEIADRGREIDKLSHRVASVSKDATQLKAQLSELHAQRDRLRTQASEQAKLLNELQSRIAHLEGSNIDANEAIQRLLKQKSDLGRKLTAVEKSKRAVAAKANNLQAKLHGANGELGLLQTQLTAINGDLSSASSRLEQTKGRLGKSRVELMKMKGDLGSTRGELAAVRETLKKAQSELAVLREEKRATEAERDAIFADSEKLRLSLNEELMAARLENITVQQTRADNSVPIRLGNADFFAPGSAVLTAEGSRKLDKLSEIIATFEDRRIVVEGHTDTVPIGRFLKGRFYSNWELSVARAAAAVRHIQNSSNINPELLSAAGYGEYAPMASNDDPVGRRLNRRVEVVLYPKIEELQSYSELDY